MFDTMTFPAADPSDADDRIAVNVASRSDLLEEIGARLAEGRGFCVATVNLDHLTKLRHGGPFRDAYRQQTFVVADGRPIVWFSRLAGREVELVPGSDLIRPLCALAATMRAPVAFLGSTDRTLSAAADALQNEHPGLEIATRIAPPLGYDPEGDQAERDLRAIQASGAKICLLALGAPKQEILAARAMSLGLDVGFVSIGAGLDFIAGAQVRAPMWMRRFALEWFWRLMTNPRRLAGRYLACAMLMPRLAADALRLRVAARSEALS